MSIDQSACYKRGCVHFLGIRSLSQSICEPNQVFYCKAFPGGIPGSIQSGRDPHYCRSSGQENDITFELDLSRSSEDYDDLESILLTNYALVVDGYALALDYKGISFHDAADELFLEFADFLKTPDYDKSTEYLRMMLFFIQRGPIREGQLKEGDAMLGVAREIFLRTCHAPRPRQSKTDWDEDEFVKAWELHYEPRLEQYIEFIKRRHEGRSYRAYCRG